MLQAVVVVAVRQGYLDISLGLLCAGLKCASDAKGAEVPAGGAVL